MSLDIKQKKKNHGGQNRKITLVLNENEVEFLFLMQMRGWLRWDEEMKKLFVLENEKLYNNFLKIFDHFDKEWKEEIKKDYEEIK